MKRIILSLLALAIHTCLNAQTDRLRFHGNITTGTPLIDSDITPLSLRASVCYSILPRFSVGLGTGISKYHSVMIPAYGCLRYDLTRPHRFTPFVTCAAGHTFATHRHTSGGFYLSTEVGISYALSGRRALTLSIGYELQEYTRLQSFDSPLILSQYVEHISNSALTASIGIAM